MIKEATGQIHQDIGLRNQEFITMVYAQKFVKGDYVKLFYPSNKNLSSSFYTIKIEKLDNNINLRLLTGPNVFLDLIILKQSSLIVVKNQFIYFLKMMDLVNLFILRQ